MPGGFGLLVIQLSDSGVCQPAMRAARDSGHHLQIAQQFGGCPRRSLLLCLPLGFEKQLGIVQNAFADRGRAFTPGGIQLAGLARLAVVLGDDRGHPLAILQALARHGHQEPHRHLRQDLAFAHLLLNGLRQKFRQRQSPRYPTHAAVESARQLIQPVAEALLQLGQ
jgi:hypothetical protein